jgi:hypothetical protein
MPTLDHSFAWRFGGPLSGLPPAWAWTWLAVAGLLGAAWIVVSYRRTLVALEPQRRRVLVALRLVLWAGVLLALAGPTRVQRVYAAKTIRPLAVLVDQSASMTTPDNRHQTRADDALRRWRPLTPAALAAHGQPKVFAFADTPVPAVLVTPQATSNLAAGQTRLFASIDRLLATAPAGGWGGIAVLTDGLDTTEAEPQAALDATARAALAAGTPLYLVPGRNRYAGESFVGFRDLTVPAEVPPRSSFRFEVTLDSYQSEARAVPLRLKVGGVWREAEMLPLEAGRRSLAWSAEIPAELPGVIPLELVAGNAPDAPRLRAEVRVAQPASTRILYYQGALDWGYRFLADILRRDPAFTLTPILNLAPVGQTPDGVAYRVAGSLPRLPELAAGYDAFDVVVLANASAGQLSASQQTALATWVRGGGVLVFLAADDAATQGFAGTEIEKLLPVEFAPPKTGTAASAVPEQRAEDDPGFQFRKRMRQAADARTNRDIFRSSTKPASTTADSSGSRENQLESFAWEPRAIALFGAELTETAPRFVNFARVNRAKPGADVLARHATARAPVGDERAILLALQRYGRGQSAVLTSDALWRWKLNQPSGERGVEKFWQNLFAWLGREHARSPHFDHAPLQAPLGREVLVHIAGAPSSATVTASPESMAAHGKRPVVLAPAGPEPGGLQRFRWTPDAVGTWCLSARIGSTEPVRHWVQVVAAAGGETSGQAPDEALLRRLAERTGGSVLVDAPPAAWLGANPGQAPALVRESTESLWHQEWIFALLLSAYLAELLLRRRWHLL